MLARRRGRWISIIRTLSQRVLFAGSLPVLCFLCRLRVVSSLYILGGHYSISGVGGNLSRTNYLSQPGRQRAENFKFYQMFIYSTVLESMVAPFPANTKHLYYICTNVIQMFCVYWVTDYPSDLYLCNIDSN